MQFGLAHMIDPRLLPLVDGSRAFYAQRASGRGPSSWEELRAIRASAAVPASSSPPAVVEVVGIGDRSVPVRIQVPVGRDTTGVLLDIHGGGFYMGSAAGSDIRNRQLADALGIAVVSMDYRLAPEHPWPAAPNDCETAALWLAEHAGEGFGTSDLAVGGFSAGATLAMTTLLRLRDQGIAAFGSAVLQFGTYDLSAQTPAGRLIADEYFLQAYAGAAQDRMVSDLSPISAELADLPPVLIVVGDEDILLRDNLAMAAQLSAADVDASCASIPLRPTDSPATRLRWRKVALDAIETWLSDHLGPAL